jgi:hypothetical protein
MVKLQAKIVRKPFMEWAITNFLRKFSEIYAAQDAPPVLLTPMENGKNLQSEKFYLFFWDTFERWS